MRAMVRFDRVWGWGKGESQVLGRGLGAGGQERWSEARAVAEVPKLCTHRRGVRRVKKLERERRARHHLLSQRQDVRRHDAVEQRRLAARLQWDGGLCLGTGQWVVWCDLQGVRCWLLGAECREMQLFSNTSKCAGARCRCPGAGVPNARAPAFQPRRAEGPRGA